MKNLKILLLTVITLIGFNSCQEDDDLQFVAAPQGEFVFTNTFLADYVLPADADANGNIGAIFTFNPADFGTETNISYELQSSILGDFTDATTVSTLSNNNTIEVSIGDLKVLASEYGIVAPNSGMLNFRVRAFPGESTTTTEMFTPTQQLMITLLEASTGGPTGICEIPTLYGVGAGLPTAGWGWTSPVELACTMDGVWSGTVELQNNGGADNNFRFFTINEDWGSGRNYPYYVAEGYTIDSNFVDAMDGDNNFAFVGVSGTYLLTIDTNEKTITLEGTATCEVDILYGVGAGLPTAGWGWTSPVELNCSNDGVWSGNVEFQSDSGNNNFRFFTTYEDWGSGRNHPYYVAEGYTIDTNLVDAMDGDNNFAFVGTSGSYLLIIDTNNKTITLE